MPLTLLVIASAALTGAGLMLLALKANDYRNRLHALEAKVARLESCSRHDLKHIVRADVGEAFLFDFAKLREDLDIATRRLESFTQRAQHVANGGSPDDPPTEWKKNGA